LAVESIDRQFGRLDILVNNAGIVSRNPLHDLTDHDWSSVIEADLTACFHLAKEASRPMVRAGWGRIINVSSVMGQIARSSIAPYVTAKAGVHGLTRALAVELGPKGVNVNCIGPGFYPGSQNEVVRRDKTFYDWIASRAPLGRPGRTRRGRHLFRFRGVFVLQRPGADGRWRNDDRAVRFDPP
jgi:gluconate 5-dehydrogenase